jgi:peptide/nickel transport system substrate-binding protein
MLYDLVYAPLIHQNLDGEFEPALADTWHYSNSGDAQPNTVFELTLRKGAKFSDGTPVNAAAVVKWFEYVVAAPGAFNETLGLNSKFSEVNDLTVKIVLTAPNPNLPYILSDGGLNAGWVVSPAGLADPKHLETVPSGAGPYVLDASKTVQGSKYVFKKNPNYYAPNDVAFDSVEYTVLAEGSSRLQAQQSGQIDVAEGEAATLAAAEGAGLQISSAPFGVPFLALDLVHNPPAPLKDARVRRAMNMAVDRNAIAEHIYEGAAEATSVFKPSDVDTSSLTDYWEYNPEKAKEELAAAGYPDGFELSFLAQGGYAGPEGEPAMHVVAKDLEEIGIKLNITIASNPAEYSEDVSSFEYSMLQLAIPVWPTPSLYSILFAPDGPATYVGEEPKIEKLYEEGSHAADSETGFFEMWKYYTEEAFAIPLVSNSYLVYSNDNVEGVAMSERRPVPLPTEWSPK